MDCLDHVVSSEIAIFVKVVRVQSFEVLVERVVSEVLGMADTLVSH